jgi:dihydroorotase/N-acyl-D-amino-acid deacylase
MYDLLFRQALVIDGTGAPGFVADVAVAGGRFAAVAPTLEASRAARVVESRGLALAPGFIDLHCHSDAYHLEQPAGEIKIRQGVTLEVVGNCGASLAPLAPERARMGVDHCVGGPGRFAGPVDWRGYGEYTAAVERARPIVNVAGLVGHGTLRVAAMGLADRAATPAELEAMAGLLDEALAAGAAGMSTGLYYAPGLFAATDEVIALAQVVARRGGYYATHLRNEAEGLLTALDEALDIGRASGVPVHVSHLKAAGTRNWPQAERAVAKIEAARREGLDVTCDVYPYHFSSTSLQAVIPPWALDGGTEALVARLAEPAARARIIAEIKDGLPGWENIYHNAGWEKILIAAVNSPHRQDVQGRSVAQAAAAAGEDPFEWAMDLLVSERGAVSIIAGSMHEDNVSRFLTLPFAMIGSDGAPRGGKPHPRVYGTFPRVIRRFVRELKAFSLEEAVRKMTSASAARLGLRDRGQILAGKTADAVLFDPDLFADTATFEDPCRHPLGLQAVVVDGRLAVDGDRVTGERSGRFRHREG